MTEEEYLAALDIWEEADYVLYMAYLKAPKGEQRDAAERLMEEHKKTKPIDPTPGKQRVIIAIQPA